MNSVTTQDSLGRDAMDILKKAYNEAQLSDIQAEKLISQSDVLKDRVISIIKELSYVVDMHEHEEVPSAFKYPKEYKRVSIDQQILILEKYFPGITFLIKTPNEPLPENAEDLFVIPHWNQIANTYPKAVEKVFNIFKLVFDCESFSFDKYLIRQTAKTNKAFNEIMMNTSKYIDTCVMPAQFGIWHCGRSDWRAQAMFKENEFGPGIYATLIMIITHPERVKWNDDLMIICTGDEISYKNDYHNVFSNCLFISKAGEDLRFHVEYSGKVYSNYGPVSAFTL